MSPILLGTTLHIEQTSKQAFNLDTILLADFIKVPYRSKLILDIGTGAGAVMLYLSQKTKAKIIGIEIQKSRYDQALYNISLNHLENQLSVINQDFRVQIFKDVDVVISNPPFFKVTKSSLINVCEEEQIARHEIMMTLEDFIQYSSKVLKFGGYLYFIHRPERFAEINDVIKKNQLEIKRIRFVHPYITSKPNHILIEAVRNGQMGLTVEPPLIIYKEKHILTKEMEEIYGGRSYVTKFT